MDQRRNQRQQKMLPTSMYVCTQQTIGPKLKRTKTAWLHLLPQSRFRASRCSHLIGCLARPRALPRRSKRQAWGQSSQGLQQCISIFRSNAELLNWFALPVNNLFSLFTKLALFHDLHQSILGYYQCSWYEANFSQGVILIALEY